jgi:hypothetical protein
MIFKMPHIFTRRPGSWKYVAFYHVSWKHIPYFTQTKKYPVIIFNQDRKYISLYHFFLFLLKFDCIQYILQALYYLILKPESNIEHAHDHQYQLTGCLGCLYCKIYRKWIFDLKIKFNLRVALWKWHKISLTFIVSQNLR